MTTSSASLSPAYAGSTRKPGAARAYFASDAVRTVQTLLGLIWLLDGGLQFQSFMYSNGFLQLLHGSAPGQPGWLHDSINWGANLAGKNIDVYNTLFALVQVAIGLGLLYRRSVKPALMLSFAWALVVWWFGEGFGGLFNLSASPLTGAPGGVILYAMVGAVVWPGRPGGLLGVRGARTMWAVLWIAMAYLWLQAPSTSANAISGSMTGIDSGIGALNSFANTVAGWTKGDGLALSLICAALSAVIGIAVAADWRPKPFLITAAVFNLILWLLPQAAGSILAGGSTDPNAGPLFILLAYAMYTLVGRTDAGRTNPVLTTAHPGASDAE